MTASGQLGLHQQLVHRAVAWLYGTMRCNLVFSGNASTAEIPDAIGWGTSRKCDGSIVVECKASFEDFMRDKQKRQYLSFDSEQMKYVPVPRQPMGNWRYFLTTPGTLTAEHVEKHFPDHGLLYMEGRKVPIVRAAPKRKDTNLAAEVRYLQFALIHVRENLAANGLECDLDKLSKARITLINRERRNGKGDT